MRASDIRLVDLETRFPEQHYAYDKDGNLVGYVRVRWGYCTAYCPDAGSDEEVYESYLGGSCGEFPSNNDRKKHLRKIKACIASWCNDHPGVYGKED